MRELVAKEIAERLKIDEKRIKESLETPPSEKFGDLSLKIAFEIAKERGENVNVVAKEIAERLKDVEYFSKVEVVNGYVNFFFNKKAIISKFFSVVNENYGKKEESKERIIIEHTSVNPNKAWHIGHARNACLGDSLVKILEFNGKEVIVLNYVDDTGAQVADNVVGIYFLKLPFEKEGIKFDKYHGDEVYVRVNEMYEKDPSLMEKRRIVLKAIEEGNNEIVDLSQRIVTKIIEAQLKTAERLNIFYDLLVKESDILKSKLWDICFEKLKKLGKVFLQTSGKNKGCWIFKDEKIGEKVLVRSDETVVYAGKDIAYAMWKHGLVEDLFKYKKFRVQKNGKILWSTVSENGENHPKFNDVKVSLNVIDIRQSLEQEVVRRALESVAQAMDKHVNYIHYAYEVVALSSETVKKLGKVPLKDSKIIHMSGRKGIYINVDDILDKLEKILEEEVKKRNPEMEERKIREIAEKLAVAILKFELLKYNPKKMIVFDLDSVLKVEEGNGIYVLYSYARASNILKKAEEMKIYPLNEVEIPETPSKEEWKLLKLLMDFPWISEKAAKQLLPNIIAEYTTKLSLYFNKFYEKCKVVREEEKIRNFRLKLVESFVTILKIGLSLLGIECIERI